MARLMIMRHGHSDWGHPDCDRFLSVMGIQAVEQTAKRIAQEYVVDTLISSPYVRTTETANYAAQWLQNNITVQQDELLAPGNSVTAIYQGIIRPYFSQQHDNSLMLVSHMPIVQQLVEFLVGDACAVHGFTTAEVRVLQLEKNREIDEHVATVVDCIKVV